MSVNKLFKSRNVIIEMLEARGYNMDNYKNVSINEIEIMFRNIDKKTTSEVDSLDIQTNHTEGGSMVVKYLLVSKLRLNNFKNLIDEMLEGYLNDGDEVIFVVKDKINNMDTFNAMLESYQTTNNLHIQIFWIDNLLINITKHVMVPKMRILSESEKKTIIEKYNTSEINFPRILPSDAHAKFLGVRKGDMCEVERPSETSGIYLSYRYCF